MKSVLVFVLLGLIAVSYVSAVSKCYVCKECKTDEEAKDCKTDDFPYKKDDNTPEKDAGPEPTTTTTEPPTEDSFNCFKITEKTGDNTKVIKGCTKTKDCQRVSFTAATGATCDICTDDSCNPASNVQSWAFGSVALIAIIKMLL